jgi:non-specific serine/threonine protein kinase
LFVERARMVRPGFRLTDDNAVAVAEICRRADGLPLAIELAAARVRALTPAEIRDRLPDALRLLDRGSFSSSARHQTLEAAIRWSYDSLPETERQWMNSLAVFAGAWTLPAAARVCLDGADELQALDALTGLIEKSLVTTAPPCLGVSRYRFLETLRAFALARLRESGRFEALQARHAQYFVQLAEEAEPRLWGPDQADWAVRLEADHPNFLAALAWLREYPEHAADSLRLTGALARFWIMRAHLSLGRQALEQALAADPSGTDRPARARALLGAGALAIYQSAHAIARAHCAEAIALYRALGDDSGLARTLVILGVVAHDALDYAGALEQYREALVLYRRLGDTRGIGHILNNMGALYMRQEDWSKARRLLEEAVPHVEAAKDPGTLALLLTNLGFVSLRQGMDREAGAFLARALDGAREHGLMRHAAAILETCGALLAARHESAIAARLYAAAEQHRLGLGAPAEQAWRKSHEPFLEALARDLGAERLEGERQAGRQLGAGGAIEEARRALHL